jgi:aquaporin Z
MPLANRCLAEFFGTFWLVLGGCGSAVLAAAFTAGATIGPDVKFPLGIGLVGVALAFGLSVVTMAYAVGHISGGHFNPAVSIGLWAGKRFPADELAPYIIAQVLGAILAGGVIYLTVLGNPDFLLSGSNPLATNGYGDHSPGGYSLWSCFVTEIVMTYMFLLVILGVTDRRASNWFAPLAIGLALTLVHLISIPVTNTSVNPARSLGPALYVGGAALGQIWLFILTPIAGALLAGWTYYSVFGDKPWLTASGRVQD